MPDTQPAPAQQGSAQQLQFLKRLTLNAHAVAIMLPTIPERSQCPT